MSCIFDDLIEEIATDQELDFALDVLNLIREENGLPRYNQYPEEFDEGHDIFIGAQSWIRKNRYQHATPRDYVNLYFGHHDQEVKINPEEPEDAYSGMGRMSRVGVGVIDALTI
ncbi:hypothetical protein GF382_00260 [Candidatus Falkowbacteria bacterium]|nr:hypothetical protein [Candidatus Falkowbacteria bacterium]